MRDGGVNKSLSVGHSSHRRIPTGACGCRSCFSSTRFCAFSMERVTMLASIGSPSFNPRWSSIFYDTVCRKQTHDGIFKRHEEYGRSGVALAAGTTAQLAIDASRFVAFGADDGQTTRVSHFRRELDVGTASCHVGGDCHDGFLSGFATISASFGEVSRLRRCAGCGAGSASCSAIPKFLRMSFRLKPADRHPPCAVFLR